MGGAVCESIKPMTIVVVTGLMRSGTSPLAMMLQELGAPMGTYMRFPPPGFRMHADWEDVEFTDRMLQNLLKPDPYIGEYITDYIKRRDTDLWGVKSPFLMPELAKFKTAGERAGHEVKIITTRRPKMDTISSLRVQFESDEAFEFASALQHKLIGCRRNVRNLADLVVDINETWTNPGEVKAKLEELIRSDS